MSNEKRSLIAISLSALIFVVYYAFFFKPPPPVSSPKENINVSQKNETLPESSSTFKEPILKKSVAESSSLPPLKTSSIQTELYGAEHSNRGGALLGFTLKNYRETVQKDSPLVNLFKGATSESFLIQFHHSNFEVPKILPYELIEEKSDSLHYQWKGKEVQIDQTIKWDPKNYVALIQLTLENRSSSVLETSLGFKLETSQNSRHEKTWWSFIKGPENLKFPALYQENKVIRHQDVSKLSAKTEEKGAIQWIGIEDRYFLWGIISRALSVEQTVEYGLKDGNFFYAELIYPKEIISPASKLEKEFTVYVGPKEMDRLKSVNAHLEDAIDYGWFSVVAHPILFLLKFFHKWVGNWGVAIIILTLFIKLILHPINKKTLDSMKAMQKLQPRLAELREKFKDNRERLNVEMMNLFKTHKVNPMGGCLPMLIQMPIYIALYKVLYSSIELYHAPFFGFYKDLSAPDPYFILPILLGIFMVIQQKMTPATMQDPAQAKMMLMMPIFFSVFMLFLPVGLVIYIFVNTSMTVVQQYLHQHDLSLADILRKMKKGS